MKKIFIIIIQVFLFFSTVYAIPVKSENVNPPSILRNLTYWNKHIDQALLKYTLNYKDAQGRILKVQRRHFAYIRKGGKYEYMRHDLVYPENITFLYTPKYYIKYNFKKKLIEERVDFPVKFMPVKKEGDEPQIDLTYVHKKASEQFKEIDFLGATIPNLFRFRSVYNRAKIMSENIFENKLCYLISTKSSQSNGLFWVTKDNFNLLKYKITHEDNSQELMVVVKKRKFSDNLYIPTEVKQILINPEGERTQTIHVKYYSYKINRKLPPKTFELKF